MKQFDTDDTIAQVPNVGLLTCGWDRLDLFSEFFSYPLPQPNIGPLARRDWVKVEYTDGSEAARVSGAAITLTNRAGEKFRTVMLPPEFQFIGHGTTWDNLTWSQL